MDQLASSAGCLMLASVCGWGAVHCAKQAKRVYESGKATDSTGGVVSEQDAPSIYWPTLLGLIVLAVVCGLFTLGALARLVAVLFS